MKTDWTEMMKENILQDILPKLNSHSTEWENMEKRLHALETSKPTAVTITTPDCDWTCDVSQDHPAITKALDTISCGLPLALVGPTGSGKTYAAKRLGEILKVKHYAVRQVNRQTGTHDILGYMNAQGGYVKGVASDAIKEGGLLCIDEIDNGNENILMCLKGFMSGHVFMPYGMQEIHKDFRLCATMNTWGQGATREYVGRCPLDAALLDEFVTMEWPYDENFERKLCCNMDHAGFIEHFFTLRRRATSMKIKVIFSTRSLIQCLKLFKSTDWPITDILDRVIFRNLKQAEKDRLPLASDTPTFKANDAQDPPF